MRKAVYLFVTVICFSISFSALAQLKTIHVNDYSGGPLGNGYYYVLPRTVLKIDVVVAATESLKGPYADYAEEMLALEDVNNFDYTTFAIQQVEISSLAEPDPEHVYFVGFGERDSKELKNLIVKTNDQGFLQAVNNLDKEDGVDDEGVDEVVLYDLDGLSKADERFWVEQQLETKIDTIIRRVAVDTVMTEQFYYRTRFEERSTKELAMEAMRHIQEIRDAKFKLLTGFQETAYEAGSIKYMYEQLDRQENELLDLFRGKNFTAYEHHTFYYTPSSKGKTTALPLFRFSTGSGLSAANSGSGEDVVLNMEKNTFALTTGDVEEPQNGGVAYRVPGFAVAKITFEGEILAEQRMQINQFGSIRRLPAKNFKATFHPQTGGLKSIFQE